MSRLPITGTVFAAYTAFCFSVKQDQRRNSCYIALNINSAVKLTLLVKSILSEAFVEPVSAGKAVAVKSLLSQYSGSYIAAKSGLTDNIYRLFYIKLVYSVSELVNRNQPVKALNLS